MIRKIIASVVGVLALGAGVAYAATQLSSSDGTEVCVNEMNGLMRVASSCRAGEYPLTIGGGSTVAVRTGTIANVAWGTTSAGTKLPLTGVTLAGRCDIAAGPGMPENGLARLLVTTDTTMTAFTSGAGTIGGQSLLTNAAAISFGTSLARALGSDTVVFANGATATIAVGAQVDPGARTCTYFWQVMEAPT